MNNVINVMIIHFVLLIIMLSSIGILVIDNQEEILTKIECKEK